ncbi:hypothetical protein D3C75_1038920 [compost metagenome]
MIFMKIMSERNSIIVVHVLPTSKGELAISVIASRENDAVILNQFPVFADRINMHNRSFLISTFHFPDLVNNRWNR